MNPIALFVLLAAVAVSADPYTTPREMTVTAKMGSNFRSTRGALFVRMSPGDGTWTDEQMVVGSKNGGFSLLTPQKVYSARQQQPVNLKDVTAVEIEWRGVISDPTKLSVDSIDVTEAGVTKSFCYEGRPVSQWDPAILFPCDDFMY